MKLFQLLKQVAEQAQENATPLPQPEQLREIWHGISYSFGEFTLLSPLAEVSEIAPCPQISLLPGVKPWVRGVANVRGSLITVIDLAAYLGLRPPQVHQNCRVLVINQPGLMAGVLVDEVHGLRHFDFADRIEQLQIEETALTPYIKGGFPEQGQQRLVLSLFDLAETQEFLNIAA